GFDPVSLLTTSATPAEAGDHLVKDEERTVVMGELPECGKEIPGRLFTAGGLEDDRRNSVGKCVEERADTVEIVVAEAERHRPDRVRDTGIHRRGPDEPVVRREERVVAAHRDEIPSRIGTREADRSRGRV